MYYRFFIQDELMTDIRNHFTAEFKDRLKRVRSINDVAELISDWTEVQLLVKGHDITEDIYSGNCYLQYRERTGKETHYTSTKCIEA